MERLRNQEIDLSDDLAFEENLDVFELHQRDNYRSAFAKRNEANAFRFKSRYFENARFVIYADAGHATKYCRCGIPTPLTGLGPCGLRKLCSRCAYLDGTNAWEKFKHSFYKGNFYFLTLSYVQPLGFDNKFESEHYWRAAFAAIDALKRKRKIRGAMAVGEIAVISYIPISFNPHVHAVIDAEDWYPDLDRELEVEMQKYLQKHLDNYRTPNVKSRAIEDEQGFESAIRYPFKAMDLKKRYETVLNEQGRTPNVLRELNENVKEFIRSTTELMKDNTNSNNMKLHRYYGTMHPHPKNKGFIGRRDQEIKANRPKRRRSLVPSPTGTFAHNRVGRVLNPI